MPEVPQRGAGFRALADGPSNRSDLARICVFRLRRPGARLLPWRHGAVRHTSGLLRPQLGQNTMPTAALATVVSRSLSRAPSFVAVSRCLGCSGFALTTPILRASSACPVVWTKVNLPRQPSVGNRIRVPKGGRCAPKATCPCSQRICGSSHCTGRCRCRDSSSQGPENARLACWHAARNDE